MKFNVGSKALYTALSNVSRVISSRNTLMVLDNFLIKVDGHELLVTASDTENLLAMRVELAEEAQGSGSFLVNARRLCDIAKELPEGNVTVEVDEKDLAVHLSFTGGMFDLVAGDANQYPEMKDESEASDNVEFTIPAEVAISGGENTIFAVAGSDTLRPQLMGVLWDIKADSLTFVATDTRKLVKYLDSNCKPGVEASFVCPQKPAVILRTLLGADDELKVNLTSKSVTFVTGNITLNSRLLQGKFPDYTRVIPRNNPFTLTADRESLLAATRRVAAGGDDGTKLMRLRLRPESIELRVNDVANHTFAHEEMRCSFTGTEMVIGFSWEYLLEFFNTLKSTNVVVQLADPSRPGLFLPDEQPEGTELQMILMPMTVQDF